MEAHTLEATLQGWLDSDAGKLFVMELGLSRKHLCLAEGESAMGCTPVYYLDDTGLSCSNESSPLAAAFTQEKQDIRTSTANIKDVVSAIIDSHDWCCNEAFMDWLEKCTVEKDGLPIPEFEAKAA